MDAKLIFIVAICAVGLYLVVQILRKGYAGAMFGTGIARTLGQVWAVKATCWKNSPNLSNLATL